MNIVVAAFILQPETVSSSSIADGLPKLGRIKTDNDVI